MAKISKFFRVAVEGATCDGRTIERQHLTEMAASYNPATYGARVNMEHIRGFSADGAFKCYGDVTALKTEEVELELGGKKVKKLALFAQVLPTDDLIKINADRQKVYTSIEINPNFAQTGKAYFQGLAVTDSPASLGTEMLQFAAQQGDKNPFASRKADKGNFISEAQETAIEFEDKPEAPAGEHAGLFAAATAFFKQFTPKKEGEAETPPPAQPNPPAQPPANDNAAFAQFADAMGKMSAGMEAFTKKVETDLGTLRQDFTNLKTSVESTDGSNSQRPKGDGKSATSYTLTDC